QVVIRFVAVDACSMPHRNAFNRASISAAPEGFAAAIRKHLPDFKLDYDVDPTKQNIAESWPDAIDSTAAKEEWDFKAGYDIDRMTSDMLGELTDRYALSGDIEK